MLRGLHGLQIEPIDIEADPALHRAYGTRIPVLACKDIEKELDWPFTRSDVISFIDHCRRDPAG